MIRHIIDGRAYLVYVLLSLRFASTVLWLRLEGVLLLINPGTGRFSSSKSDWCKALIDTRPSKKTQSNIPSRIQTVKSLVVVKTTLTLGTYLVSHVAYHLLPAFFSVSYAPHLVQLTHSDTHAYSRIRDSTMSFTASQGIATT